MKMKNALIVTIASAFVTLAIVLTSVSGFAQEYQRPLPADPQMVVVPVRSAQEISTDLENARITRQLAIHRNMQAVERLKQIAGAIESRESSIDNINDRKDDAKDNQRESEEKSLKIEEKANKKAIDLLKRLKSLREAEVDVAESEEDHADLTILVLQREGDLQEKRSEYNWPSIASTGDLARNTAAQVLRELEVNLLELQKDLASATQNVASKQKKVVEQRMKLHEAQSELGL
jgi:vacuolar-type H+-ATPase subunit I/STV1